MTTFESNIITVNSSAEKIFEVLSDLSNLEKVADRLPSERFKDIKFDKDRCTVNVEPVGTIGIEVIDREPPKTIKFVSVQSPIDFNLWIQIKQTSEECSKVRLTIKSELSSFLKPMVEGPLQEALNKLAEMIAIIPF